MLHSALVLLVGLSCCRTGEEERQRVEYTERCLSTLVFGLSVNYKPGTFPCGPQARYLSQAEAKVLFNLAPKPANCMADGWGYPFAIRCSPRLEIVSSGSDRILGTQDDLVRVEAE